jgi:hypothetical protein
LAPQVPFYGSQHPRIIVNRPNDWFRHGEILFALMWSAPELNESFIVIVIVMH